MMIKQTEPPRRVHRSIQMDVNSVLNQTSRFVRNNQDEKSETVGKYE